MAEPEQSVGMQVEAEPSAQMQVCDALVGPRVIFDASAAAAFWIPVTSPAAVAFWAPYCTPAKAAFDTSIDV